MLSIRRGIPFLFLAGPLLAQQLIETFSYPDGPVPGWTARSGSWAIVSGRMRKTSAALTEFITKDGISSKNCVLDLEAFLTGSSLQLAGVLCRHPGTNGATPVPPMVYGKIQGSTAFNTLYVYDTAGTIVNATTTFTPTVQTAYLRLITLDGNATLYCDADKNGIYELTLAKTINGALGAGQIGCVGYSVSEFDNFKFYDGVLVPAPSAVPKVGTTFNMRFATPAPQFTPWFAAFALKNTGIPLGNRSVPLALDPLLDLTLGNAGALGLAGIIDANGDGNLAFPIPNNSALVGFAFYAAALTIDGTMPFSIGVISEDLRVVIQA